MAGTRVRVPLAPAEAPGVPPRLPVDVGMDQREARPAGRAGRDLEWERERGGTGLQSLSGFACMEPCGRF